MDAKTRDVFEAALAARTYREFLGSAFTVLGSHSRTGKFNHSTFARKAGLKSRGFASEVVSGRKRLTAQSLPKFEKALGLPARVTTLFRLLVIAGEPDLNDDELSPKELSERIESARARLKSDLEASGSESKISRQVHRHRHVLAVYATLGNQKTGVTFDDIVRRTKFQPALIRRVLDHLLETEVATVDIAERYRSINPHLVFKGMGGDHPIRDSYLDVLGELQKVSKENFSDGDKAFIHSHVSVDPRRLGELKKRLWDVVLEYIDECDDDDGEAVAKLLVGFYV